MAEREPQIPFGRKESEIIAPVKIGGLITREGSYWVISDMGRNITLQTIDESEQKELERRTLEGSVLDLSPYRHVQVLHLIDEKPIDGRTLEGPLGKSKQHITKWHAIDVQTGKPAENARLTPQRIAHLVLNSPPGIQDLSRLGTMFTEADGYGIQYYIVESLHHATDPLVWHDKSTEDKKNDTARVLFIHPVAIIYDRGNEKRTNYSSKEALKSIFRWIEKELVVGTNTPWLDSLKLKLDAAIQNDLVVFAGENGLPFDDIADTLLAEQIYRTQVITAALMAHANEDDYYKHEFERLWTYGNVNFSRLKNKAYRRSINPLIYPAIEEHDRLILGNKTSINQKSSTLSSRESEIVRNDLLAAITAPLSYEHEQVNPPIKGNSSDLEKLLYFHSSIFRNVWNRKHTYISWKDLEEFSRVISPEEIQKFSQSQRLYHMAFRLRYGLNIFEGLRLHEIENDHDRKLRTQMSSVLLLADQFDYYSEAKEATRPQSNELWRFPYEEIRRLTNSPYISHRHIDRFPRFYSGVVKLKTITTYQDWVNQQLQIYQNVFIPIRNYTSNRPTPQNLPALKKALSSTDRLHAPVTHTITMLKELNKVNNGEILQDYYLIGCKLISAETIPIRLAIYGLLTEYYRLASNGASNEEFLDWVRFTSDTMMKFLDPTGKS